MAEYVFGANILENLTTGMYKSSQIIFREYIQNSCDAIDKAIMLGILPPSDGEINIWIDSDTRSSALKIMEEGSLRRNLQKLYKLLRNPTNSLTQKEDFAG